ERPVLRGRTRPLRRRARKGYGDREDRRLSVHLSRKLPGRALLVRIAIPALGTRGDVLPYVVLGDGLHRAGHDVIVSTTERFRGLVENAGLRFHALPGDPSHIFAAAQLNVSPRRPLRHVNAIHKGVDALVGQVRAEELLHAWGEVELVVFG